MGARPFLERTRSGSLRIAIAAVVIVLLLAAAEFSMWRPWNRVYVFNGRPLIAQCEASRLVDGRTLETCPRGDGTARVRLDEDGDRQWDRLGERCNDASCEACFERAWWGWHRASCTT